MSVKPHLMEDEEILDYCMTKNWAWVVTDRRLIKYRSEDRGGERLHDISFDEISSASMVNQGRKDELGGYAVFSLVVGVTLDLAIDMLAFTVLALPIAAYLVYRWRNSQSAYFQFRGSGLLQQEEEEWRIDKTAADDPDQIRDFVKTVRSQL